MTQESGTVVWHSELVKMAIEKKGIIDKHGKLTLSIMLTVHKAWITEVTMVYNEFG